MKSDARDFLLPENRAIIDMRERFKRDIILNPDRLLPWLRSCKVRVLILTDGLLDFSTGDFGLSTFVMTLLDTTSPARFEVTLAHLENRSGTQMMSFEPRIKERIPMFAFDETAHFMPDKFDIVFLFGIRSSLARIDANGNDRIASNGQPYPRNQLAPTELQVLAEFQNGGGGLFATGDHGALGRFMGQAVPRARNMRLWDSTTGAIDEVSMTGTRRNDTNRIGNTGSQFDDQSDDIPQRIQPKMYSVKNAFIQYSFPHPVLCGPKGVIKVMPDHPHEGECIRPRNPNLQLNFTDPLGAEYPPAADGGARPLPEIISTNSVLSGITSGTKAPTQSHTFGGICTYDGHRANVGRVITDSTWHHFVNINLVGENGNDNSVKSRGFLASARGQQHFESIKAYYRNLGIWLSRRSNIRCMNSRLITKLINSEQVIEAVLTTRDVKFEQLKPATLWHVGRHARDVLAKFASQCQARRLLIDVVFPEFDLGIPEIDPWRTRFTPEELQEREIEQLDNPDGDVTWINFESVLDMALGAALVTVSENVSFEINQEVDDDEVSKFALEGAKRGLTMGHTAIKKSIGEFQERVLR